LKNINHNEVDGNNSSINDNQSNNSKQSMDEISKIYTNDNKRVNNIIKQYSVDGIYKKLNIYKLITEMEMRKRKIITIMKEHFKINHLPYKSTIQNCITLIFQL